MLQTLNAFITQESQINFQFGVMSHATRHMSHVTMCHMSLSLGAAAPGAESAVPQRQRSTSALRKIVIASTIIHTCVCAVGMSQIPASAAARIARVAGHMMRPAPTSSKVGGMLEGQVAIITGSGQGIGAAAALLFAQHGAAITVCDIDATKAQSTAASISSAGGRAIVVAGDVMDPTYADKVVAETLKAFGKVGVYVYIYMLSAF